MLYISREFLCVPMNEEREKEEWSQNAVAKAEISSGNFFPFAFPLTICTENHKKETL